MHDYVLAEEKLKRDSTRNNSIRIMSHCRSDNDNIIVIIDKDTISTHLNLKMIVQKLIMTRHPKVLNLHVKHQNQVRQMLQLLKMARHFQPTVISNMINYHKSKYL